MGMENNDVLGFFGSENISQTFEEKISYVVPFEYWNHAGERANLRLTIKLTISVYYFLRAHEITRATDISQKGDRTSG